MRTRIIGCAESDFKTREDELNLEELVFLTAKRALKDAGMEKDQIDTVIQAGDDVLDGININHAYQVEPAGAYLKEESKVEEDGAFALFYGLCRLATGNFNTALIIGYSKSSESSLELMDNPKLQTSPEASGNWYYHTQLDPFYLRPLGLDLVSYHAMQYQQFLAQSILSVEDIARITIKNKQAGLKNPNSLYAGEFSMNDVLSSPEIASPVREIEVPKMTDGVSAIIIASEKWAKENKKDGVCITGVGSASDAYYPGYRDSNNSVTSRLAKQKALAMANKKITDIQLAELYELFAFQEAMLYRDIFEWKDPEIQEKLQSNYTAADGGLPVNASGGITCAHPILAAGLSRIIHASKLMRQKNLDTALTHSQSGLGMQSNIVYILQS